MTEKRFTITQDFEEHHRQIRDNGHIIMGCFVEPQAEVIVDLLNELAEENKELQEQVQEQERRKWACLKEAHRLDLENEQLKEENKELKSLCKVLIKHIEKNSIAFVIDEEVRRLLE